MSEDRPSRYERGAAKLREVYAGDVVDLPEGTMAFNDVMIRSLWAEVWDRDVLDVRSRRLLILGVIAANGQVDTFKIQARAALRRRELTPDELRETLVMLAPYAGYPNVAGLIVPVEEVINTWVADGEPGIDGDDTAGDETA
jgi:4-carboxymuconolactone decarboxylase